MYLKPIVNLLPETHALNLIKSLSWSHLWYCPLVWGPTGTTLSRHLKSAQNLSIRLITKKPKRDYESLRKFFKEYELLNSGDIF